MPVTKNFMGANVDPGTWDALRELAFVCGSIPVDAIDGFGCYSTNPNSAGMDWGGGHCDINAEGLSDADARTMETRARSLGFLAYFRPRINPYTGRAYGWQRHVHLERMDCVDLSQPARWQVGEYKAGWDGLATRHRDTGNRAYVDMTWAKYMEANVTNDQMQTILAAIADQNAFNGRVANAIVYAFRNAPSVQAEIAKIVQQTVSGVWTFKNADLTTKDAYAHLRGEGGTVLGAAATTAELDAVKAAVDALTAAVAAITPPKA